MFRRRFMPPENVLTRLFARSVSPTSSRNSTEPADASSEESPDIRAKKTMFSRAVRSSYSARSCGHTPMNLRTSSGLSRTDAPPMVTSPESGVMTVLSMRMRVVLPAPFGPRSPNSSPWLSVNDTSSTAVISPNDLLTFSAVRKGSATCTSSRGAGDSVAYHAASALGVSMRRLPALGLTYALFGSRLAGAGTVATVLPAARDRVNQERTRCRRTRAN